MSYFLVALAAVLIMMIHRLLKISFVSTLSLAPVYWFFFIDKVIIASVKVFLIGILVMSTVAIKANAGILNTLYMNTINRVFLMIFIFMFIGYYGSNHIDMFSLKTNAYNMMLYSYLLSYIALSATFIIAYHNHQNYFKIILLFPAIFVVCISTIHFVSESFGLGVQHPSDFRQFSYTGFSMLRTGWSNSISLFAIIIPTYVSTKTLSHKKIFLSFIYGSLPILIYQSISGGRAGFISSICAVVAWMYYILPKKYIIFTMLLLPTILIYGPDLTNDRVNEFIYHYDDSVSRNYSNYEMINRLSGNRLLHYDYAMNLIIDNPLVGVGVGNARITSNGPSEGLEIHNVFLRGGAELGILFMIILFVPILYALSLWIRQFQMKRLLFGGRSLLDSDLRINTIYVVSSLIIILSGLIVAFVEPRFIYGGVGQSWVWWISLSIFIFNIKNMICSFNSSYRKI